MTRPTQTAIRITFVYVLASVFWIAFSDSVINNVFAPDTAARVNTLKGIAFVLATGAILLVLIRRSLTQVQRSESAFTESEYRWRELVEQITNAIVILDGSRIAFANPAAAQLIGAEDAHALIGRCVEEFLIAEDVEDAARGIDVITRGRKLPPRQYRIRCLNGEERTVEAHSTTIPLYDYPVVLCVLVDVTQRVEQRRALLQAKTEAERLAQAKASLLTNMSHEIRTPLTSMLGISELLAEEASGEAGELASLLQESGWRLMRTLDSILTLAQLDSNAVEIQRRPLDVGKAVSSIVRTFEPEAAQKRICIEVHIPERPIEALADAAALDQIIMNLLSNAFKFTRKGRVAVRVEHQDEFVRVDVEDTGVGISESFLPYLYEEYRQESEGLRRNFEGSGLGLAIVKRLVDMMDGRIDVESRDGVGTKFSVELPAA